MLNHKIDFFYYLKTYLLVTIRVCLCTLPAIEKELMYLQQHCWRTFLQIRYIEQFFLDGVAKLVRRAWLLIKSPWGCRFKSCRRRSLDSLVVKHQAHNLDSRVRFTLERLINFTVDLPCSLMAKCRTHNPNTKVRFLSGQLIVRKYSAGQQ